MYRLQRQPAAQPLAADTVPLGLEAGPAPRPPAPVLLIKRALERCGGAQLGCSVLAEPLLTEVEPITTGS